MEYERRQVIPCINEILMHILYANEEDCLLVIDFFYISLIVT